MTREGGTIEQLAHALGEALQPLQAHLSPGAIGSFFDDLGIRLPPGLLSQAPLPTRINAIAGAAGNLTPQLLNLQAALAAGPAPQIISAGAAVLQTIAGLLDALAHFGTELNGVVLAFPGLTPQQRTRITSVGTDLKNRAVQRLLVDWIEAKSSSFVTTLALSGLIDDSAVPTDVADPLAVEYRLRRIRFDLISDLLGNPESFLQSAFGLGLPGFDGRELFSRIEEYIEQARMPVSLITAPGQPAILEGYLFRLAVDPTQAPPGLTFRLRMPSIRDFSRTFSLKPPWSAVVETTGRFQAGLEGTISAKTGVSLHPPAGAASLAAHVALTGDWGADGLTLLGQTGSSRLSIQRFSIRAGIDTAWNGTALEGTPAISVRLDDGKAVIDTSKGDSFLHFLTGGIRGEGNFALAGAWTPQAGLHFDGSSGLELALPMHAAIGPARLDRLYLRVGFDSDGSIPVEISAAIAATVGPLAVSVDRLGVIARARFPKTGGNLGPLDLGFEFKPPTGVGLSVDVGIIKGGGFLSIDVAKGEYVGAMELDFIGIISLKAIAIINTKMPDGSEGFSLLIIITADFPPIQLGFGFTLNAVGGLLGLNRTVNIDALREGVRTNAIKSVLFPQDVVANITRIVSDLKQIFPPLNERLIVGPMAELGWGTPSIIKLELGILIEIPVPRIAILGVLAAFLPAEELALLRIQVNFLGVIDFDNKSISFDASLFDSRLLIYTLTGDMAFRLSWGDHPMFILSVGGFHPAYHDAPQDLQHMTRLGISLLGGDNPRISVLSYFAVTSNTVQFGARAELYAAAAGFNVYGFIGYDVLFQFDPFKFIASFEAGLALREGTDTIMGIHLAGQLSGINPWNARGEASITILFLEISVSFNETWGDDATKVEPPKEDILARLTTEINDNRNWRAEIPDSNNLHVSIRKMELPPDQLVIHPMGVLTFSERLVPLGVDITKFGNKVPLNAKRFDIKATDPGILTQNVTEEFAPANFFDKNDNEKLSSPSFDRLTSGFKVTGASSLVMPAAVSKSVDYELTYLHKKRTQRTRAGKYKLAKHVFKASTKASAAAVSTLSYARNRISANAPDAVTMQPPQYGVANVSDMRLAGPDLLASSYTEASQKYKALIARRPELKDQVQILAHHELNGD